MNMNNYINLYKDEFAINNVVLSINFTKKIFVNILNFYESNKLIKNINLHRFSKKKYIHTDNTYCSQYNFSFNYENLICKYFVYNYTYELTKNINQKTTMILFTVNFPNYKNYNATENNIIIKTLLDLHVNIKKCIFNSNLFDLNNDLKYDEEYIMKNHDNIKYKPQTMFISKENPEINKINTMNSFKNSFCNSISDFNIYNDEENQKFEIKKNKRYVSFYDEKFYETKEKLQYCNFIENTIIKITKNINSLSTWIGSFFWKNNIYSVIPNISILSIIFIYKSKFYATFFAKKM